MPLPIDHCPSADDLAAIVAGGLAGAVLAELEHHIDNCESCRVVVSGLALGSTARPRGPAADHVGLVGVDADHYVLGDEIARGGMGRIFRARDRRLGRDVAIKETFAHSGDGARFEREARITARLQHPSIVHVHEAGVWPTGEPFFAMQLVPGRSLDEAITAAKTLEERLALVPNALAVADAIAYAHSQAVIHRDLKPRNVIVGEFGETVVIDWGLAKDLDASAPEADDVVRVPDPADGATAIGAVIGTPAYMPPEQALGEIVDRRADVYAIGAILYHVLSGRPPVTGTARDAVLATVVAGSVTPLGELQPGAPADLLAIVTKAMAFEPSARYADARELAQDLRKFQTGQLVGARQYAWSHLLARWLRRHRTAVTVAAAAIVVLAATGAVSLYEVVAAKHTAEKQRAAAVQNRGDAEDLLAFMLGDLHDKLQPLGKTDLLDAVAHKAIAYYQRRGDDLASSDERHKQGVALTNLGDVLLDEGHAADALAQYRASLAIGEMLVVLEPGDPRWLKAVATRHERIGDVLMPTGDHAGALGEYRDQLDIAVALAARAPDSAIAQRDLDVAHYKLAGALTETGKLPEAIAEYRAGVAISTHLAEVAPSSQADRDLALDHAQLGMALANHGEHDEAVAEHRAALKVLERAAARDPSDQQTQATIQATHMTLGEILEKTADHAGAVAEYRAAIDVGERVTARDSTNVGLRSNVAFCRTELADAEHALGQDDDALQQLRTALAVQVELSANDPTQLDRVHDIELSHRALAKIELAHGDRPTAMRDLTMVRDVALQLAAKDPSNVDYRWDVADAHMKLGEAKLAAGDHAVAVAEFRAALLVRSATLASDPTNADAALDVAAARAELGEAIEPSDPVAALAEYRAALPALDKRASDPQMKANADELRGNIARLTHVAGAR
ncbi:MAG TPA: serine/threonine-protein kinase [Kofleriaceae bacterium]|jgi:tetratricopeptide (TPR) repeat protein|nr:serine/threonine-protein kinase [Kofleriaceae bacterium]